MLFTIWSMLAGCNDAGFAAVALTPIYGWEDGCTAVSVTGHGFSKDIAVKIGGNPVENAAGEAATPEWPADKAAQGYSVVAYVPAAGGKGYADVEVVSGGETSVLGGTAGYYYVECPLTLGYADANQSCGTTAGATLEVSGCNLDVAQVQVMILDADGAPAIAAALPLVSTCRDGHATFVAPDLPDGVYYATIVDLAGTVLSGTPCTAEASVYGECGATAPADAAIGDTADSGGATCVDYPLYYGGAP